MATVGVVGSVNLDLVVSCERLPRPGETITDGSLSRHPGGKGANQALAARRMGAEVRLMARVGSDDLAEAALALLRAEGVDLTRVGRDRDAHTGIALVVVDARGENQIVVAPGANRALTPAHVDVAGADAVLCQLEVPAETVAEAARQAGGLFVVNAAPARPVPQAVLERADVVVVNEVEQALLADRLADCDGLVVVTVGSEGAVAYRRGSEVSRARPPAVPAVDTVGAGDAFVGALVVALTEQRPLEDCLARACAAGALATTGRGAQPSLPTAAQVEAIMAGR